MSGPDTIGVSFGREAILSGALDRMVAEAHRDAPYRLKTVAERTGIKRAMLARLKPGEDAWLFAYGSLIWNPAFAFAERRIGRVYGYHRRFAFWTRTGRGTPDKPGLMLALEPGGSCCGLVYRIAAAEADEQLQSVFLRELLTGSYHPRWIGVRTGGERLRAIAFIANRDHRGYAGRLPPERVAHHVAEASGRMGPCRDYLVNTVRHLDALGIRDRTLSRLMTLVDRRPPP